MTKKKPQPAHDLRWSRRKYRSEETVTLRCQCGKPLDRKHHTLSASGAKVYCPECMPADIVRDPQIIAQRFAEGKDWLPILDLGMVKM